MKKFKNSCKYFLIFILSTSQKKHSKTIRVICLFHTFYFQEMAQAEENDEEEDDEMTKMISPADKHKLKAQSRKPSKKHKCY